MNDWISVDKLPSTQESVLVWSKNYGFQVGIYVTEKSINTLDFDDDYDEVGEYDKESDEYYLKEGWYLVGPNNNYDEYWFKVECITHWTSLPDKP